MRPKLRTRSLTVLLLLALFTATNSLSLYAQTVFAPDQCRETPQFPVGGLSGTCSKGKELKALYSENFDDGFSSFTKDSPPEGNTFFLRVSQDGSTPTSDTGPETTASCNGSTNEGEFIYFKRSFATDGAHCMSRTFDLTDVDEPSNLSFWHYMYGDNIGELNVKINGVSRFALIGEQQTANGQDWRQGLIDLRSHAGDVVDVQICMSKGLNLDPHVSRGEISIDQVEVYACESPEEPDNLLDLLPAILANVERRPPPPPPPARWQVTNRVYCPSFRSEWIVSDGEASRSSLVRNQTIFRSNTSSYASVEPGNRTFTWRLETEQAFTTCGLFSNSFTRTLKPGYDYNFILKPNGAGFSIETQESKQD